MVETDENVTYVVEEDDWVDFAVEPFRSELLETIRRLSLNRLQRYPTTKRTGLPVGRELDVLARYLGGRCASLEPSAFARAYMRLASTRDRLLLRAFLFEETLPAGAWIDIIGRDGMERWMENRVLREDAGGCYLRFRVFGIGPATLFADGERTLLHRRVMIGQDGLNLVEFLRATGVPRAKRYLDVGPGSGIILLAAAPSADDAVGLDLNPRAVAISKLSADLSGMTQIRTLQADVFSHEGRFGSFDLVTWNMPFIMMPASAQDSNLEGFGGSLGIEIQVQFLELLPSLLTQAGRALLGATSTILATGENLLDQELARLAPAAGLDVTVTVDQLFYPKSTAFPRYARERGVKHFENLFLDIRRGPGRVRRIESPWRTRAHDALRRSAYRVRG